ncbi:hypothetical protein N7535_001508 [Penicillium sp. DV-2018c]|nr:hypothetical protein N7461_005247 [Penicillium sp. DV-2018c]KAJ5582888.1 hypothetical protein N7535_001508 [Penicillium sp. DV-2018c]
MDSVTSLVNTIPKALEPRVCHSAVAFAAEADKITALESTVEEPKGQLRCSHMRGRNAEDAWMRALSHHEANFKARLTQCKVAYRKRHEHKVGQPRAEDFDWQRNHEVVLVPLLVANFALGQPGLEVGFLMR